MKTSPQLPLAEHNNSSSTHINIASHRQRLLHLVGLLFLLLRSSALYADDQRTFWTGTAGDGLWSSAGNWSAGVPTATNDAVIDLPGDYTITIDSDAIASNLTVSATSGAQTISVPGATLQVMSVGLISSNAVIELSGGTLMGNFTSEGTINWTGGTIANSLVTNSGQCNISNSGQQLSDATIYNNGDASGFGFISGNGNATVINNGTFRVPSFCFLSSIAFTNRGVITQPEGSSSGYLSFYNGIFSQEGTCRAATNATLNITADTGYLNDGARFEGDGTINLDGHPFVCDGTIHIENPVTAPDDSLFDGSATFTGSGTLNWRGTLNASAQFTFAQDFHVILSAGTINGAVTNNGTISTFDDPLNISSGQVNLNGTMANNGSFLSKGLVIGNGTFNNANLFIVSSYIDFENINFTNTGTILKPAESGGAFFFVGGSGIFAQKGICQAETNAVLGLGAYTSTPGLMEDGGSFNGDGKIVLDGTFGGAGTTRVDTTVQCNPTLTLQGSNTFIGIGALGLLGLVDSSARITLATGFQTVISNRQQYYEQLTVNGTIDNNGTTYCSGQSLGNGSGVFNNEGLLVVGDYSGFDSVNFTNTGTILKPADSGGAFLSFSGNSIFSQKGICRADTNAGLGISSYNATPGLLENGCAFTGDGKIVLDGTFGGSGTVHIETLAQCNSTLTFQGTNTFTGSGSLTLLGMVDSTAQLTFTPDFHTTISNQSQFYEWLTVNGTIINKGTANCSGQCLGNGAGVFNNENLLIVSDYCNFDSINFTNTGTILKSADTGGAFISFSGNSIFSQKGTCKAETNAVLGLGSYNLTPGLFENGGVFNGDGKIVLDGTFGGAGTTRLETTVQCNSTVTFEGTNTFAGAGPLLLLGVVDSPAQITFAADLNTVISNGWSFYDWPTIKGRVENYGTVYGTGQCLGNGAGIFNNRNRFIVSDYCNFDSVNFTNLGTILRPADSGGASFTLSGNALFSQKGICRAETNSFLDLGVYTSYPAFLENDARFCGEGAMQLSGGTFQCNGTIQVDNHLTALFATLDGTGTFTGTGTVNWSDSFYPVTLASSAHLTIGSGFHLNLLGGWLYGTLNNNGTVRYRANMIGTNSAVINNHGLFSFENYSTLQSSGTFNNDGTVRNTSAANWIDWAFNNSGIIEMDAGTLTTPNTYAPNSSASQHVILGGYSPGSDFGQFSSGALVANGDVTLMLTNSFVPTNGSSFSVMNYPSHSGNFATTHFPALPQNLGWNADLQSSNLVLTVGEKATILEQPHDLTVNADTPAQFTVTATNVLTYQWLFHGASIAGATDSIFTITSSQTNDAGNYSVIVSNAFGTVTSSTATLTVLKYPAILTQPVSVTNFVGETASFHVTATGATPLAYQWRKNDVELPGMTKTDLILDNVQATDAATYSVVVSNSFGSVTSDNATLTVFTTNIPGLFNTGVDDSGSPLSAGATDHHYVILSSLSSSAPFVGRDSTWLATNAVSAWITPTLASGLPAPAGLQTNVYRLTFDLSILNPSTVQLTGNWSCDNDGIDILLNGISSGQSRPGNSPDTFTAFSVTNGFVAGLNTLDFKVRNTMVGTTKTPTGLRVEFNSIAAFGGTAPTITVQPKLFSAGGTTGLVQVVATGSLPLSYQWRTNGVTLPGATNASVSVSQPLDASAYDVVVANAFGSVTSATATAFTKGTDITRPTIVVLLPRVAERLTNILTTALTGTAADVGSGVARVLYRLNGSEFEPANGTTNWNTTLSLIPGTNKVDVKALDYAGNESLLVSRTFFAVIRSQFHLATNGAGAIAATPNALGTPTNTAMLEVGRPYILTATPGLNQILSNWSGTVSFTNAARVIFIMQSNMSLAANFIPNPFIPAAGAYHGLFYQTNISIGVTHQSSGFFSLTVGTTLGFSGKLSVDGDTIPLSGKFNVDGTMTNKLSRARFGKEDVTVNLALDFSNGNLLNGRVRCGTNWTSELKADRAYFNSVIQATTYAGKYTMILPLDQDTATPGGDGWGTMTVSAINGTVVFSGALGDGITAAQTMPLSQNGDWPFYVPLYPVKYTATNPTNSLLHYVNVGYNGSLLGWLNFNDGAPSGTVSWIKTSWTNDYYADGFTNAVTMLGSSYLPPLSGQRSFAMTNGTVTLTNGNLTGPITRNVTLNANNTFSIAPTNQLVTLSLNAASGSLTGSFRHPDNTNKVTPIKGVILQKQKLGAGNFLGTNASGELLIRPN